MSGVVSGQTEFTGEMAIEVVGNFGISLGWRDNDEQCHDDCVGGKDYVDPYSC